MMAISALLLLFFSASFSLVYLTAAQDTMCRKPPGSEYSPCLCLTDDGAIINLNPLSNKDGSARFIGLTDDKGYTYDYNPCSIFSDKRDQNHFMKCKNVYICQTSSTDATAVYTVANTLDLNVYLDRNNSKYYLKYDGPANQRQTKVYLNCDQSIDGKITSVTETIDGITTNYVFQLYSCHACPGGCEATMQNQYIEI